MNEKDALHEALRLNRLYPNDYKRYKRAIKNQSKPEYIEKERLRLQAEAEKIALKDKKNAIIDELTDMCWYSYGDAVIKKAYVDKLIKELLREKELDAFDNSFDNCSLEVGEHTQLKQTKPLTQAELQEILYYDAITGEFEWNTGVLSGKKVELKQLKPKPLRKQNTYALPLKPRTFKPSHAGYTIITEQEYLRVMSGADDKKIGVKYKGMLSGGGYIDVIDRPQKVYKRHYLVRTKGGKSPDTQATKRITYYIKEITNPYPRIKVRGVSYTAHGLATLYMGAGGDWNYSKGIDNVEKIAQHAVTAPHGLKHYNPKTNKPMKIPSRDGDRLNLKWENIKPKYGLNADGELDFSTAVIFKVPTTKAKVIKKRVYGYARNIKEVIVSTHGRKEWHVVNMGALYYGWSEAEAQAEFGRRLDAMKGTKQTLRNGCVMVTR